MTHDDKHDWILERYPESIQKEQLYQICHISKRTAALLLRHKLIPCQTTGKKTRQYTIVTNDVVHYLRQRERNPDLYRLPPGSYCTGKPPAPQYIISPALLGDHAKGFYASLLKPCPDVLSVLKTADATGYCVEAIRKWYRSGKVIHFVIDGRFMIPKLSLLEFMLSGGFRGVKYKTAEQKTALLALLADVREEKAPI